MSDTHLPDGVTRVEPRPTFAAPDDKSTAMNHLLTLLESDDSLDASEIDFETAPLSLVLEFLENEEVAPRGSLEEYGLSRDDFVRLKGQPEIAPLLPRADLTRHIRTVLLKEGGLVVLGSIRSGKSTLVRQFMSDPTCMRPYERSFMLDCFVLRGSDPNAIDREALWSFLEMQERTNPAVRRGAPFWGRVAAQGSAGTPLTEQILAHLSGHGLLVLDHLNYLNRDQATERWLGNVVNAVRNAGNHVLAICTTAGENNLPHRRIFSHMQQIKVENVSPGEIGTWLLAPFFEAHRFAGLTAGRLHRVTGGRPGLLRDFAAYLGTEAKSKNLLGARALMAFGKLQANSYSVECDGLVQTLRRDPKLLLHSSAASGEARHAMVSSLLQNRATTIREDILATGAVVASADEDLVFASPIFARRFRDLTASHNLVLMLGRNDPEATLASSKLMELLGVPLRAALLTEQHPHAALVQFAHSLVCLGLSDVRIYLRDSQNARLWSLHRAGSGRSHPENGAWPLTQDDRPEFSKAVLTGRRIVNGRSIFLPVIGPQGRVELVATGLLSKSLSSNEKGYCRRLTIRMVWNIVLNLQPPLALIIERLRARRKDNLQRQLFHRTIHARHADPVRQDHINMALREASCSAIAVLERNRSQWFVAGADEPKKAATQGGWQIASMVWVELLEGSSTAELDDISNHPSARGLVLSGSDLNSTFPRIRGCSDRVAIFLRPVWTHSGAACRIVVFIFEGAASRAVSGARQAQLSAVAPFALQ